MNNISIDIETYSSINLAKAGVYKYTESPDFEILLFGYSIDSAPVEVIDLAMGERIPKEIIDALAERFMEKAIIKSREEVTFVFKCGLQLTERM